MAAKKSAKKVAPLENKVGDTVIDDALELEKVRGLTDSQQDYKEYHEGKFQTHDPVTGEKRDKPLPQ